MVVGWASRIAKGVITELTEVSPDNWQITDEKPAGAGEVAAIVRHYDGQVDTLKGEALQQQMQQYASVHPTNTNGFGMMDVLMWSSIGYMAGRMMSPNPRYYANPNVMNAPVPGATIFRSNGAAALLMVAVPAVVLLLRRAVPGFFPAGVVVFILNI